MWVISRSVITCQLNTGYRSLSTGRPHRAGSGSAGGGAPTALPSTAISAANSASVGRPLRISMCRSVIVASFVSFPSLAGARSAQSTSQGDVPVLLGGHLRDLSFQQPKRRRDVAAGVRRRDHRVDVAALGGDIRVDQRVLVLLLQLQAKRINILAVLRCLVQLLAVHEADRA